MAYFNVIKAKLLQVSFLDNKGNQFHLQKHFHIYSTALIVWYLVFFKIKFNICKFLSTL